MHVTAKRAPAIAGSPQAGHARCAGAPQWMQKRPAAGVASPQPAQIISAALTPAPGFPAARALQIRGRAQLREDRRRLGQQRRRFVVAPDSVLELGVLQLHLRKHEWRVDLAQHERRRIEQLGPPSSCRPGAPRAAPRTVPRPRAAVANASQAAGRSRTGSAVSTAASSPSASAASPASTNASRRSSLGISGPAGCDRQRRLQRLGVAAESARRDRTGHNRARCVFGIAAPLTVDGERERSLQRGLIAPSGLHPREQRQVGELVKATGDRQPRVRRARGASSQRPIATRIVASIRLNACSQRRSPRACASARPRSAHVQRVGECVELHRLVGKVVVGASAASVRSCSSASDRARLGQRDRFLDPAPADDESTASVVNASTIVRHSSNGSAIASAASAAVERFVHVW